MLIIILIVLIIFSMLFSISESSILGMNKLRLRILRKNKNKRAIRISKLLEKKEQLINTLLISNDLVNIFISSIIATVALKVFGDKGVGIATVIATILLLIFGEITPKTISTRCPDKIAYFLSGFVKFVVIIMTPLVKIITYFANIWLRVLGIKTKQKNQSYTQEEIRTFFDVGLENGILEHTENHMMNQVFKFSDLEAQDVMVPRPRIRAININSTYRQILELSQRLGFMRFPVYKDSIDDIVGVIYIKDLLAYKTCPAEFNLQQVMKSPIFILGTKKISSVQSMLFENRQSMAIIVDEYSGTDGIITQNAISRQIFALPGDNSLRGKILDTNYINNQNDFEINGLVLLQNLSDILRIPLQSNINETIGGWVIEKLNRMPVCGDIINFQGWSFIVIKVQSNRIERLRILKEKREKEFND